MIWLAFYQAGSSIEYERMDSFAIIDNRDLYFNGEKMIGTVTDRSLLEGFLVDRINSGQPSILRVDLLPGWEEKQPDTRDITEIF